MREKIEKIKKEVQKEIERIKNSQELFDFEKKYLGRKSEFNKILKSLKDLAEEEKKTFGNMANETKAYIQELIESQKKKLGESSEGEELDVTLPGKKVETGKLHVLTQVKQEVEDIFIGMGFGVTEGPEVENEWHNFTALNMPADHPARDMQDTFWLKQSTEVKGGKYKLLPRTQTSNSQIRHMEKNKPPFRIVAPGRVFRNESTDASHEHTFYQLEALVVGKKISVANFKYIAQEFFNAFFEREVKIRLRPGYFPFVEPGFEFDIECMVCEGEGCRVCKNTGWLEVAGAGMVNQKVFEASGYEKNKYQGFAWGFGLNRMAMMKYKINDIRLFVEGDIRFLKQF